MNKRFKFLIIIALLPLSIFIPVYLAQTVSLDSQVYAQQSTLQQRVEQYKSQLNANASKADLSRLKLRCSVAQTVLKNLTTRITTAQTNRTKVYSNIDQSLKDLTVVLKEKSIETTKLEEQTKELNAKINQFNKDAKVYQQAVDDAANIDCTKDPIALKAAIQVSRLKRESLTSEVTDIRQYINNVIKPTLVQVRADIVTQQKASSTNTIEGTSDATQQ